ncbi:MAG: FIST C-terminal domain-containing protein [Lentisphaerota bacterium]
MEIRKLPADPLRTVMVLLAEKSVIKPAALVAQLKGCGLSFCGAVFPSLIFGNQTKDDGVILLNLPVHAPPVLIQDLTGGKTSHTGLANLPKLNEKDTVLVLVDGLSAGTELLLEMLRKQLGNAPRYFGGGAGSGSLQPMPCIFNNNGVYQDAALVVPLRQKSAQGVRHGWLKLAGPFTATRTNHNTICELNDYKAFEVYRAVVEADNKILVTPENFSAIGPSYPFGIIKEYAERIVRDPIRTDGEGGLICVGDVPQGVAVDILKGDPNSLIKTSAVAARDCLIAHDFICGSVLVADCVSRRFYLNDRFKEELTAVAHVLRRHAPGAILEGMLTLGEISTHGKGYLDFFNKTLVVCALGYERAVK